MNAQSYDKLIIGAGFYGLYAALKCAQSGQRILVLESDSAPFSRATYINQARVHMGYHYPRSFSTAIKSAHYFDRFCKDFGFCCFTVFDQVYATSSHFSWTNAQEFRNFCHAANIRCDDISPDKYFNKGLCDGAFVTTEYTYDAQVLKQWFLDQLKASPNVEIKYNTRISKATRISKVTGQSRENDTWHVQLNNSEEVETPFILNTSYAGVNEIHSLFGFEPFKIKYELCEIILCSVSEELKNVGITVMDGPFFSIMPFGKTGLHSLTSVTFTPHKTSYDSLATFECMKRSNGLCSPGKLYNCNNCPAIPESAWPFMSQLARKYLKAEYAFEYKSSLFSMKPILLASEIDDSRPTVIRQLSDKPTFISVLSGKINTVYDLDEVLQI